ncbi:MAG: hypothetical protein CBC82_04355 [Cellvibrionales bacterium TMED122]|nr:MAG: hypothetical protein CBC82_04355 [Cellvibrionales bacterium TMED122]
MIKKLRTPLILFLLSSPFIFLDLYSKYLAHKHITSEDKEIVLAEDIILVEPLINKGWALQDPDTVTIWTTISRNIALSFLSIFFLLGALEGGTLYERVPCTVLRSGILANTIDALFFDGVTDFILINSIGGIANIADLYLFFGGGAFILSQIIPLLYVLLKSK